MANKATKSGSTKSARPPKSTPSPEAALQNEEADMAKSIGEHHSQHGFGYGSYRPAWLQIVNNPKCLLLFLCCCAVVQSMIVSGLMNVSMAMFEKRFYLTKFDSGFLIAAYEFAVALVLLPIAHYGEKGRKSTWIGFGMLLMGSGSIICASTQFAIDQYEFDDLKSYVCGTDEVSEEKIGCTNKKAGEKVASNLILVGQFLHGFGAAPLYTLGVTFLDENVLQSNSALYIGILYGVSLLGSAIGYIIGGASLNVYGDLDKVDTSSISITPDDPRWYGAWWMGFILCGAMSIILVCPVMGFAHHFSEMKENRSQDWCQQHDIGVEEIAPRKTFRDTLGHLKFLFMNWTWSSLLLMKMADWFYISGFHSFFGTILENFFSFPPAWSHIIAGAILVPGGFFGNIVGGIIVSRTKMGVRKMFLSLILLETLALLSIFGLYAYCSNAKFSGVTHRSPFASPNEDLNLTDSCNRPCNCGGEYNPICYKETNVVYFSPCYAGCQSQTEDTTIKKKTWHNCTCLTKSSRENSAEEGFCHESCSLSIVFISSAIAQILFTFSAHIPAVMAELRCVHFDDRTLAISVSWIFVRIFGTIPGSFLYRWLVDRSCILWNKTCDGSLKCVRYDNTRMARFITGTGAFWKFLVIIFVVLGHVKYNPVKDAASVPDVVTKAPTRQDAGNKITAKSVTSPASRLSTKSKNVKNSKQPSAVGK